MDRRATAQAAEAIRALGRGDVPAARTAIAPAYQIDHEVAPLLDAVNLACTELEEEGEVSPATWNTIADAVDSPELFAVVEGSRS
ncbi:MAG: hypothetical protein ACE5F5_04605 [Acidimicrobiia bacterium]